MMWFGSKTFIGTLQTGVEVKGKNQRFKQGLTVYSMNLPSGPYDTTGTKREVSVLYENDSGKHYKTHESGERS